MNNSSDESSAEHPMDVDNFKTRKNATSNRNIFVPVKYVLKYMRFFNHFEEYSTKYMRFFNHSNTTAPRGRVSSEFCFFRALKKKEV